MKRIIIVDSCAEMNQEMKNQDNIRIAPFYIDLEGETLIADENLDIDDFIQRMNNSRELVKTAAPTPDAFYKNAQGFDEVFMVTISSKLSGTYNSANIAKSMLEEENPNIKVHVFDSKSAASGETQIVYRIQELIKENETFDNIVRKIEEFKENMETIFVLENLDNLIKNGRMSRVAGFVASALNIYPICVGIDGEISVKHKSRGLKKAISQMVDTIGELVSSTSERELFITHIRNEERANIIKELVEEKYNFRAIRVFDGSGLSTTYANKNGIIMAF